MCRSTHVSDEFSFPFTFGAATVRCLGWLHLEPHPTTAVAVCHTEATLDCQRMDMELPGGDATLREPLAQRLWLSEGRVETP